MENGKRRIVAVYLLSEAGQVECLRRNVGASEVQLVRVGDEDRDLALELVEPDPSGVGWVFVGGRELFKLRDGSWIWSGVGWAGGPWGVESRPEAVQAGGRLVGMRQAWELRQESVPAVRLDGPAIGGEAVRAMLSGELLRRNAVEQSKGAALKAKGERESAPETLEALEALEAAVEAAEQRALEEEAARAEREEAQDLAEQEALEERARWIREHGSELLRQVLAEGLIDGSPKIYLRERLAAERPGWIWDFDWHAGNVEHHDPRYPGASAMEALRAARHDTGKECSLRFASWGERGDPEAVRELIVISKFLGDIIVMRFDQESRKAD